MSRKFIISIETENAAFERNPASEIKRIIKEAFPYVREALSDSVILRDINGNRVGYMSLAD